MKQKPTAQSARSVWIPGKSVMILALGTTCVVSSFSLGLHTAADVQTISRTAAGSTVESGDVDGNGVVDTDDVILILEIAQGYTQANTQALLADPNQDGNLHVEDALSVLQTL